ncbi:MAG: hypothetical protein LBJ67_07020 [Planctomycetaceae bacterium]|nr:hypothetical protein [Planctomycetaceae bacterium]
MATEIEQTSDKLSQEGSAACYRYIAKLYGFDTSKEKKYTEKELRQRQREKLEYVADGDYSKLQYIISSNQKHYQ